MFVEDNKLKDKKPEEAGNPFLGKKRREFNKEKNTAFVVLAFIVVAIAAIAIFLFLSRPSARQHVPDQTNNNSNQNAYLPGRNSSSSLSGFLDNEINGDVKAEFVSFGDYYKLPTKEELAIYTGYSLPFDLKNDAVNYFDITRKFNLDDYIEELNQNGFVVINNAFNKEADDFYSFYRMLAQKEIPSMLSTDFVLYYFQNELKNVYQEIEKNVFYDNLWLVYKEIYDVALARYKNHAASAGLVNNTLFEAERQEVEYLAVMLHTLKPTETQISKHGSLLDINKFNENEAYEYNFFMPDKIKETVKKEIELLRGASQTAKSPVFLRSVDYRKYKIPVHYVKNAKQNNFYLAIEWLQTPWPLYYQSEECPDCTLDYRDWMINMAAAAHLAQDLNYDQDLKNKWATIYKFVSFFIGLEKDLTYLDYIGAYKDTFGEDFSINRIFSDDNTDRDEQMKQIQKNLENISLNSVYGGKKRDTSEHKDIGMRLLQDFYWPNDYLLNELVGENFVIEKDNIPPRSTVVCPVKNSVQSYRCKGSGFDVINILYDYEKTPGEYAYNNLFSNYQDEVNRIKTDFKNFNLYEWHETIYWTTLHLVKQYLDYDSSFYPEYTRSEEWQEYRDLNTVLGAWVNLHVPADTLEYKAEQAFGTFDSGPGCNQYNTIEIRPDLINALISKSNMLIDILATLGVSKKTSVAAIQLKEMNNVLLNLKKVMLKAQKQENLNAEDCKVLKNFSTQYQLITPANKSFTVNFAEKQYIKASNNNNKLMLLLYQAQGETVIGFAPIFNYKEY